MTTDRNNIVYAVDCIGCLYFSPYFILRSGRWVQQGLGRCLSDGECRRMYVREHKITIRELYGSIQAETVTIRALLRDDVLAGCSADELCALKNALLRRKETPTG